MTGIDGRHTANANDVLVVATEWSPRHGGLSVFNKRFCESLAACGMRVVCYVPPHEQRDEKHNLTVLPANRIPGMPDADSAHLLVAPDFSTVALPNFAPQYIIGHDDKSGPHACHLARALETNPRRIHFVHTSPEIEDEKDHKQRSDRADKKTASMHQMLTDAHVVVGVGPRLAKSAQSHAKGVKTHVFIPGLDMCRLPTPVFSHVPEAGGQGPFVILMLSRTKDPALKGIDTACRAAGMLARTTQSRIDLVIRGCDGEDQGAFQKWCNDNVKDERVHVRLRTYVADPELLQQTWDDASVLVMPSAEEGFGLVALEAAERGVPLLLSENSGFADFIRNLDGKLASKFIVDQAATSRKYDSAWCARLSGIQNDPGGARRDVLELRERLLPHTWDAAVAELLRAVGIHPPPPDRVIPLDGNADLPVPAARPQFRNVLARQR